MPRMTLALPNALLMALLIAGCSTGTAPVSTPAPSAATPTPAAAVAIREFEFQPVRQSVRVGAKVTWTNEENSLHTVTSGTPEDRTTLFDSGEFDTGERFAFTFQTAGTYAFFCDRHEFMRGEIVVTP